MFNKTKSPAPQPRSDTGSAIPPLPDLPTPGAPAPSSATAARGGPSPVSSRGLSTLSSDLQFDGNISGGGDLQIDGAIKGDVRVGRLIVGETGAVEGGVSADYVEVRGRIVGNVSGKQVKLIATAYVDGDITAEQLSIDIGAYFQGRVLQGRRDAPAAAPKPSTPAASATPPHGDDRPQIIDMKPGA
ncbi:polymer-forming cytoskeletal protein [Roseibacterium beibuensis]|uniref:bactofilin family protein n=1 Tax=[Roseibacterium] beibuensis TaxID=1193142 RepID=UPI00217DACBC|nr:polymer-forming cytoskeletal protein [Roseibacterium beibuensis]MCS6625095.1 polymer-forming cytoskeletal protein [Roseibacterium beibuensis]